MSWDDQWDEIEESTQMNESITQIEPVAAPNRLDRPVGNDDKKFPLAEDHEISGQPASISTAQKDNRDIPEQSVHPLNQELQKPDHPKYQQPQKAPQQEDNWSFWSSVSAITAQIKHAAEETIDNAYAQLDPEYNQGQVKDTIPLDEDKAKPSSNDAPLNSPSESQKSTNLFETKDLMKTTENVLNIVDKGFDYASEFLGNTLYKGYETGKQFGTSLAKSPPMQSASESTFEVKKSVSQISSKLVDVSLDALEGIGKNIYDIAPRTSKSPNKTASPAKPLQYTDFDSYFHEITGKAQVDALAVISSNRLAVLNWDVDELLEAALDDDEISSDSLNSIKGKKLLEYGIYNSETEYLMFLCESTGVFLLI
eukprot:NODE_146_length_17563_cov_0.253321.p3 type:complete len:368 gc:universal NODE_146_length_17563_cov_0.253321:3738-4841(+)